MRALFLIFPLFAMACTMQTPQTAEPATPITVAAPGPQLTNRQAAQNFVSVVGHMEPIVEQACREMTTGSNCDFLIVVDDRPNLPPNAFQTLRDDGRPVLGFTVALLRDVRNKDELAFVLGHESAHHIRGHLARQQRDAMAGAVIGGIFAAVLGADANGVDAAQQMGGAVGARGYSKDYELEADHLGALLTKRAGYDPVRGAAYFARIPDPGNQFLGTHPPNASRIETVRRAVGG